MAKVKCGKRKNWSRKKDRSERLAVQENDVREIRKEYFESLYNRNTEGYVTINIWGFDGF